MSTGPRIARVGARIALALLLAAATGELVLRALSTTDADGQVWLLGKRLPPLRVPLGALADSTARYRAADDAFLVYDPRLGWAPRPHGRTRDGLARANGAGLRDDREIPREAPPGVARVALFGDSFTFGDEVPLTDTWGAQLEADLAHAGFAAQVLNFGVNAYGIDQAYLRWHELGRLYRPDVVVFGLQPENALRDLNVFRPLYFAGTEVPLSKPRFVPDGDGLRLVNSPALPPEEIAGALAAIDAHPLRAHERFLDSRYDEAWWQRSRLAAFVAALASAGDEPDTAHLDAEASEVALRILRRFAAEVEAAGARFVVVHLPRRADLAALASRAPAPAPNADLVARLGAERAIVEPGIDPASLRDDDFAPHGHYRVRLNAAVARALEPVVAAALCDGAEAQRRVPGCAVATPPRALERPEAH